MEERLKIVDGLGARIATAGVRTGFAMTGYVIPRSEATWESVFFVGQGPRALPRWCSGRRAAGWGQPALRIFWKLVRRNRIATASATWQGSAVWRVTKNKIAPGQNAKDDAITP